MKQNTVTQQQVDASIDQTATQTIMLCGKKHTIVCVSLTNGFTIIETSTCVDPKNYDQAIGEQICLKAIKSKIWNHLGFQLSTDIHRENQAQEKEKEIKIDQHKPIDFLEFAKNYTKELFDELTIPRGLIFCSPTRAGKTSPAVRIAVQHLANREHITAQRELEEQYRRFTNPMLGESWEKRAASTRTKVGQAVTIHSIKVSPDKTNTIYRTDFKPFTAAMVFNDPAELYEHAKDGAIISGIRQSPNRPSYIEVTNKKGGTRQFAAAEHLPQGLSCSAITVSAEIVEFCHN